MFHQGGRFSRKKERARERESTCDAKSFMKMTGNPCAEWELECEWIDPLNPGP